MDPTILHNACIVSFYMDNIDPAIVASQKAVVEKFNKRGYPHYQIHTNISHAQSMDYFWGLNGIYKVPMRFPNLSHDIVFFLDIDAVPLTDHAIDYYIESASRGVLIGNIQRSNHIQNNQHVFAAPSAVAVHREIFKAIGAPSAIPTNRSDVCEEYTWKAEETGVKVELMMPLCYDRRPTEVESWALKDGMPVYGQGTTFGNDMGGLFYHHFQIFHPGSKERFIGKCKELLGN